VQRTISELLGEGAALLFDLLGTVAFILVGIEAELLVTASIGGDTLLAAWAAYVGALALYAGVVVFGRDRLLPRLRDFRGGSA
jgi:hypothetical protein